MSATPWTRAAALWVLAALSGCQTWPVQTAPTPWQNYRQSWTGVNSWEAGGRFALRLGKESGQGLLSWRQNGPEYVLLLTSPWAQGGVQLEVNAQGARLKTADGQTFSGDDPEALLLQQTGMRLPVASLGDWLRALPAPGQYYRAQWDDQGQLQQLSQWGWIIRYQRYSEPEHLPVKFTLAHDDIEARLVIDTWNAPGMGSLATP